MNRVPRRALELSILLGIALVLVLLVSRVLRWGAGFDMREAGVHLAPRLHDHESMMVDRPHFVADVMADPGSVERVRRYRYSTNSHALRGPEIQPIKPPGTLRVLAAGDCVAFGVGVADHETWPAVLEALLAERMPGREIEVINAGLPGVLPMEITQRLRDEWMAFEPDLVLFAPGTESALGPEHTGADGGVRNRLEEHEYQRLLDFYRDALRQAADSSRQRGIGLVYVTPTFNSFGWPDIERWVQRMHEVGEEQGVPVLDSWALIRQLEAREGLVFEDAGAVHRLLSFQGGQREVLFETPFEGQDNRYHVAPEIYRWLDEHPEVELAYGIDENHPNARGQRAIAQAMFQLIEAEGLLEPAPPAPPSAPPSSPPGPQLGSPPG
jgi:lysophospholipase L1-like esterase